MKHVVAGAALVAASLSAPAAGASEPVRRDVAVKIADLDLRTREGVAELDRRLARAVVKACGTAYYLEPQQLLDMDRCREAARVRAMAVRESILDRAGRRAALASRPSK